MKARVFLTAVLLALAVAIVAFVAVVALVPSGPDPTDHDVPPPWRSQ